MILKKIMTLLICFQFALMPVLAYEQTIYSDYDFSDEAQEQFDKNKFTPIIIPNEQTPSDAHEIKNNFKKQKSKKGDNIIQDNTPELFRPENNNFYIPQSQNNNTFLQGSIIKVPEGTPLTLTFDSGISSGSSDPNDRLTASLQEDWVYMGRIIAPSGSIVYGMVTNSQAASRAYGSGSVELVFNQILTPDGNVINIRTEKISLAQPNERAKYMTRDILIGTGIGLLTGLLFAAGSGDYGSTLITTGSLGLIGGGMRGYMQLGKNIQIPDGTKLEVRLESPINISPYN